MTSSLIRCKPDDPWPVSLVKVAAKGISDQLLQLIEGICLGEYGVTKGPGLIAALGDSSTANMFSVSVISILLAAIITPWRAVAVIGGASQSPGGSQAVGSKDLPVELIQHHANGIGCQPVSVLSAAPRLRCRAGQQGRQVGTQFPTVLSVLHDVDRQGYDVGRAELPRHSTGQTGARPVAPASRTVSHHWATPAGRCPSGLTMRARE